MSRFSKRIVAKLKRAVRVILVRCVEDVVSKAPVHERNVLVDATTYEHAVYAKEDAIKTFSCDHEGHINHMFKIGSSGIAFEHLEHKGAITVCLEGIHAGIIVGNSTIEREYSNRKVMLDSEELAILIGNLKELQVELEKAEFEHLGKKLED